MPKRQQQRQPRTPEIYLSVDVEADGPVPLVHSMLSLGACVAGTFDGRRFTRADPTALTHYAELRPVGDAFDPEALAVSGLDRDRLLRDGAPAEEAMTAFASWVRDALDAKATKDLRSLHPMKR